MQGAGLGAPGSGRRVGVPLADAYLEFLAGRVDEWGWDQAPPRVPMFPGDLPRQDHPLPRALDDVTAARLLRAAQNDRRLLVRVTVEMLLRTGLRVGEYTSLRADAVVHIGAGRGCTSRSASSAKTGTCRCTRSCWP